MLAARVGRGLLLWLLILPCWSSPARAMLEDRFLFFPSRDLHVTPAEAGLPFEEVVFPAADGTRLHGWLIPADPAGPLVLFCHGNAGNIADRLEALRFLHDLGLPVFIFDYRGYGRSAGTTSEAGTYADGRGALDWLAERGWQPQRLIYLGRSLGAGVALRLAIERPPAALVLETPFTSVAAMGRQHYPLLFLLAGWLLQARYDNLAKIGDLKAPLLLVQGTADAIVPPAMADRLFERAPQPKRLLSLAGAGHNDLFASFPEYRRAWRDLLASLEPDQAR